MGTSSQFHDSMIQVQLNIFPTFSSAEILLLNWAQEKTLWRSGAPFLTIMQTLIYNSASFLTLANS